MDDMPNDKCDSFIKALPKNTDFIQNVSRYMQESGIRSLMQDGLLKAVNGITTIDEVARVCG